MADPVTFALVLLFLLQVKHLFADFFFQTPRMLRDRSRYVHVGRAQHAGLHALGSVLAMMLVGVSLAPLVLIAALEWVAHYHIDWGKGRWSDHIGHGPDDAGYWRAFGFDQALHQWTYLVMVWAALP
ncbi:MAG: DUF3307 domain-containing protein [Pseudomonadota bacterium]